MNARAAISSYEAAPETLDIMIPSTLRKMLKALSGKLLLGMGCGVCARRRMQSERTRPNARTRKIMIIRTYAMNSEAKAEFIAQTELDAPRLMVLAESREQEAREKGRHWIAGTVPFYAEKLIAALRTRSSESTELEADNVAMSAWLCDSIYDDVTAEQFVKSDLIFTVLRCGVVKYDRVPAGSVQVF